MSVKRALALATAPSAVLKAWIALASPRRVSGPNSRMIARVSRSWLDTCNPTKPKTKKITSTTTTAQASSQGVSVGSAAALSHHHRLWNSTYLAMKYRAWCWVGAFNDMVNNVITLFLENGRVLWKQFCQSIHSHQVLLFSWFGLAC